jgi:hypothetical protein
MKAKITSTNSPCRAPGKVALGRTDVARTGIGIAVRKGAPKPDVGSAAALRRALLIHARAELPQRERQGLSDGVARSSST